MKKYILFILLAFLTHVAIADVVPNTPAETNNANKNENKNENQNENETVTINSHLKIISKTIKENNPKEYTTIDVLYPQITGIPLKASAKEFNKEIIEIVNTEITKFKNSVKRDTVHMQTLPESVRQNTLNINYDVDVIHPNPLALISVRLNIEGMQAGRAHPFHAYRVLNFDLTHGKKLALSDLFKTQTPYLNQLAKYSTQKLETALADKWMIAEGAKPNLANYKNWNIQADSILITFDDYQVAPYSNGPQEVEIPFSQLKNLFSPKLTIISQAKDASRSVA